MNKKIKYNQKAKTDLPQLKHYDSVLDPDQRKAGRIENLNAYEASYRQNKS